MERQKLRYIILRFLTSLDLKCRCISLSDAFDFQRGMISDRTFGPFKTGQMCNGKMQSVENEVLLEYRRTGASKTLRSMVTAWCGCEGGM